MQRILVTFLVCLFGVLTYGQKLDKYGRKMVRSVTVRGKYYYLDASYDYDTEGIVNWVAADIRTPDCGYRLKTKLTRNGDEITQKDEIDEYPSRRTFSFSNGRITSKCFRVGGKREVYDYVYDDNGRLLSWFENHRNQNSSGTFDYEIGIKSKDYIWVDGNISGYADQYHEYYIRPLPEIKVRRVRDYRIVDNWSKQYHRDCIVFSDNENNTNLCIEAFIDKVLQHYVRGIEFTCDWMGMRSDKLPDYVKTSTRVQVGNKFVQVCKGILYDYDENGNMTGFSVSYDHDYCGFKAYETMYHVEFQYVM